MQIGSTPQAFKAKVHYDYQAGTVCLPIDPIDLSPLSQTTLIGSRRFSPVSELCVEVIDRSRLDCLTEAGVDPFLIADTLARLPKIWRIRRMGVWFGIVEPGLDESSESDNASVIEVVSSPEGEAFFRALSKESRSIQPMALFHITWLFHGDSATLSLPDRAALERIGTRLDGPPV